MSAPALLEMAALRAKLLAVQTTLQRAGRADDLADLNDDLDLGRELVDQAIALLNIPRDPDVDHGPVREQGAVQRAARVAADTLLAHGVPNPALVLIVQSHDDQGRTTGRSLAATIANPQDLLRIALRNIEDQA